MTDETSVTEVQGVSGDDVRVWATVAANSFGGPAGQIAVIHEEIVERRGWVSESSFLHALNYCMLLPGPEAQQLATYLGWLRRGIPGGLLAGGLFVLPGFVSILLLSVLYVVWGDLSWVQGMFRGIGPAVVAIVAQAVVKIGRRTMKNRVMVAVAVAAFVAIFFYRVPFPLIVGAAGLIGLAGTRLRPDVFSVIAADDLDGSAIVGRPPWRRTVAVVLVGAALWLGPVVALVGFTGRGSVWSNIAVFFSQAAVVTFGGAYSVLAFIAQQAVDVYGWLQPGEMIHGLGLAETTPGPLIMVVEFVGFLGAYRNPGGLSPMTAGILGAVLTTWVTFVPSFLWILAGAPYVERLKNQTVLTGALSTITSAVVGVVLNLGVWFALFTLFSSVDTTRIAGATVYLPDPATLDWAAVAIAVAGAVALFRYHRPILQVVIGAALVGLVLTVI